MCNMDCFNCSYPDCINDMSRYQQYREANLEKERQRDRKRYKEPKRKEQGKQSYLRNREKRLEYYKARYQARKEQHEKTQKV